MVSEEMEGYWDTEGTGGFPIRSYFSIFQIKYQEYDGDEVVMPFQVFEDTDYDFSAQWQLEYKLEDYCSNQLGRECRFGLVDAYDDINFTSDAENTYDLRAELSELFNNHPMSFIRMREKDDEVIKWVVDTFPKANLHSHYTIVEPEDNNGVISGGVYGDVMYVNGKLISEEEIGDKDYSQVLLDINKN